MNINNLQIILQEAIDNSTKTVDYLLLSKAIQALNMGQIRSVATFANLPAAASNEGLLVFVTADERLYWSTGTDWYCIVTDNKATAWSWGCNSNGWLADNTTTNRSSPVSVVGGFTDWCQIDSNITFFTSNFLGVRTNGSIWGWGDNSLGQRGDGTTINRSSPVLVVGGFTDWCQVTAGDNSSHAIRINGTLWSWGRNDAGGLANGNTTNSSSPVSVVGGFTDWCQVSAGNSHVLAVRKNGTLWSWGTNQSGQLGNGFTLGFGVGESSPVSVIGGFTDWCQVSAGSLQSIAIRTDGTLWSW